MTLESLLWFLALVVPILLNVAFITLLERKVLSLSQSRIGPNKVGSLGLLQPFADVVKLFSLQLSLLSAVVNLSFIIAPALALCLALLLPMMFSVESGSQSWKFSILFFLMILSLNVYPLLLAGWSSNSKYAFTGGLRGVAQTISYEISLAFIIMAIFLFEAFISFSSWSFKDSVSMLWIFPVLMLWGVSCVAELNRTPFDFSEGESELVSGFNVEYGATKFAMIFMAEYAMIMSLSLMTGMLITSSGSLQGASVVLGVTLAFLVIWLRATFPRYRYDLLMNLAWKNLLPWSLGIVQISSTLELWAS